MGEFGISLQVVDRIEASYSDSRLPVAAPFFLPHHRKVWVLRADALVQHVDQRLEEGRFRPDLFVVPEGLGRQSFSGFDLPPLAVVPFFLRPHHKVRTLKAGVLVSRVGHNT